jgi:hypothetical protein
VSLKLKNESVSTREEIEWCVLILTPSSTIYHYDQGVSAGKIGERRQNRLIDVTRERHVEAWGEGAQWQFG